MKTTITLTLDIEVVSKLNALARQKNEKLTYVANELLREALKLGKERR